VASFIDGILKVGTYSNKILADIASVSSFIYSAYQGNIFSQDGVTYYKEKDGVCSTTSSIGLKAYNQ
jgi:hypothetical protein